MQRPNNLKVGDKFRVIERYGIFKVGEIVTLKDDDGTDNPFFWNKDKSDSYCTYFSNLEPYAKTIRDAQVGDVVVGKYNNEGERMVLERGQNTVLLSYNNDFKKANSATYTFDELEEYFILKTEPVAEVVDKTASREKVINDLCKVLNIRNMTAREISSILEEIEKLNEKD